MADDVEQGIAEAVGAWVDEVVSDAAEATTEAVKTTVDKIHEGLSNDDLWAIGSVVFFANLATMAFVWGVKRTKAQWDERRHNKELDRRIAEREEQHKAGMALREELIDEEEIKGTD